MWTSWKDLRHLPRPVWIFAAGVVAPAARQSGFALYRLAVNLGMALGPAVGGNLATIAFGYLFLADGAPSLPAGLMLAAAALPRRPRLQSRRDAEQLSGAT